MHFLDKFEIYHMKKREVHVAIDALVNQQIAKDIFRKYGIDYISILGRIYTD